MASNSVIFVLAGVAIGGILMILYAVGAFANLGPVLNGDGDAQNGQQICDLAGQVSGTVNDANFFGKSVDDLKLQLDPANCKTKTGPLGFSITPRADLLGQMALLSKGHVDIYVKLYKGAELIGSQTISVDTEQGEATKFFSESIYFRSLIHGQTYTAKVTDGWNDPEKVFNFTA